MSNPRTTPLYEKLVHEMRSFISSTILYNQVVAERLGVTATDLQCLGVVEMMGSATPGQLAEHTRLTTGGVTVMLDRLEKAGYVKRERNPNDRRSVLVRVVAGQRRRLLAPYEAIQKELWGLLADFSEAELETVIRFFQRNNAMVVEDGGAAHLPPEGKVSSAKKRAARGTAPVKRAQQGRSR